MGSEARAAAAFALCTTLACASVREPVLPPPPSVEVAARPLSHDDCVELALSSVPDAAAWRARLDAATAALAQAGTLPNPLFALGWEDLSLGSDLDRPHSTSVSLGMALADVLLRKGRTAVARHELAAEEASLLAERLHLAAEVRSAYDALVAARRRVALEEELVRLALAQRDALLRFTDAGFAARLEVERSEAQLAEAELERERAGSAARSREIALAFALGFECPVALALSEPMTSASELEQRETTELLALAAARRPEFSAARQRYAAELERLHLAVSPLRFLPTVEVGTKTESGDTGATAALEVLLPVFDTGSGARSAAEAALLAGAADLRRLARDVGREVTLAAEHVHAARVELEQHARSLAERRHRLRVETEALFVSGELTYADVLAASREETKARRGELAAEESLAGACIDVEAAAGIFSDLDGVTER